MQSPAERKKSYQVLSGLFRYPESSQYQQLFPEFVTLARLLEIELPADVQSVPALLELEAEYTSLFVNSFGGTPAPPYGSVYLDPGGRLMGESSLQVAGCYDAEGLNLQASCEPPDYLATELEYLYYLVDEEEAAAAAGKTARLAELQAKQIDFLNRYLLPWIPAFCQRISGQSEARFYPWIAQVLQQFLQREQTEENKSY